MTASAESDDRKGGRRTNRWQRFHSTVGERSPTRKFRLSRNWRGMASQRPAVLRNHAASGAQTTTSAKRTVKDVTRHTGRCRECEDIGSSCERQAKETKAPPRSNSDRGLDHQHITWQVVRET